MTNQFPYIPIDWKKIRESSPGETDIGFTVFNFFVFVFKPKNARKSMQEVVERCLILVGKGRKVFQTNWTNKFIYSKMSIHMFLPVVFVFQSVVFVLEEEIDLLQQHMVI